ncbi:hypothetical protein PRIPAC_95608 [Pristionchus pacificus]|uniref:Uncharacterized protein n=1 Tax=Pristionchus pacificus TaxID=54126 RepID=A0A454XL12_PRIPA|nr:hypothetical protein PRIPAC_95608 [Pristionchus pacificus]|eukprot:PDM70673.1 hypothetical protein PRIPAC_43878 [Pristionchus pacificus]
MWTYVILLLLVSSWVPLDAAPVAHKKHIRSRRAFFDRAAPMDYDSAVYFRNAWEDEQAARYGHHEELKKIRKHRKNRDYFVDYFKFWER